MNRWSTLVDRLSPQAGLAQLTTTQTQAVIDLLCLLTYADNRISALEQLEFEETLMKMEWATGHRQVVRARINTASAPARYAASTEARQILLKKAINQLGETVENQNESIFKLMASMAYSVDFSCKGARDFKQHREGLGIANARAQELQEAFGSA